jgi:hypothetical protein
MFALRLGFSFGKAILLQNTKGDNLDHVEDVIRH